MLRWALLVAVTVGVTCAAHPDRRPVGRAVRRAGRRHRAGPVRRWLPPGCPGTPASPHRACSASTSARWSTRTRSAHSAPTGRSCWPSRSPPCCSASSAGALLALHRDVTPLTGALALVAGGASGLVAIARELGGDDRVVSVVQYLRVGVGHAPRCPWWSRWSTTPTSRTRTSTVAQTDTAPWYLSRRHADRAGRGRCRRRPADPAARRRPARPAGADGGAWSSAGCRSACRCRWCWSRSAT